MLGKLTKYEIKATARIFLPLYAGLLLFALINKVFIEINLLQTRMAFLPHFLRPSLASRVQQGV